MKKRDLQPTMSNIKKTFINDSIGRNSDLKNFIEILASINENYSIALDSSWGSGKTFFVKQVKMIFDASNDFSYDTVENQNEILQRWDHLSKGSDIIVNNNVTIYYDAWENDSDDDPIYSLIYQIIADTNNDEGLKKKITFKDVLAAAGKITEAIAGFDPNAMAESLKKDGLLDDFSDRKSIIDSIKQFIDSILPEHGDRLIIIIDELDRCNPQFAVKLLERIKHYFYNDKITFIFSINLSELQHTIKHYYGKDFDAGKYLDRFFDLRISLPPIDMNRYYHSIDFFDSSSVMDNSIKNVIKKFNLQLREISKYITMIKAVTCDYDNLKDRLSDTRKFIYQIIIPMAIGLKLTNPSKYYDFISGNDSTPLKDFYSNKETIDNVSFYLSFLYGSDSNMDITIEPPIYLREFHNTLDLFYNSFFNKQTDQRIGKCYINKSERDYFFRINSLLSKSTVCQLNDDN